MAGLEKQGHRSCGRKGLLSRKEGIVTASVPTAAEAPSRGHSYLWVTPGSSLCSDSRVPVWLKIFRVVQRRFDMEPRTSFCSDLHRFLHTKIQTISDTVVQTSGCPWGEHAGAGCRAVCAQCRGPALAQQRPRATQTAEAPSAQKSLPVPTARSGFRRNF